MYPQVLEDRSRHWKMPGWLFLIRLAASKSANFYFVYAGLTMEWIVEDVDTSNIQVPTYFFY